MNKKVLLEVDYTKAQLERLIKDVSKKQINIELNKKNYINNRDATSKIKKEVEEAAKKLEKQFFDRQGIKDIVKLMIVNSHKYFWEKKSFWQDQI